jgi:hypothetical protein
MDIVLIEHVTVGNLVAFLIGMAIPYIFVTIFK